MLSAVPLERDEQVAFVQWLERVGLKFTAVPNSTYTKSAAQKSLNRYMGLRAGFPDMIVLVPPERAVDGKGHLLCPEMKRLKGSTTSTEQKHWIAHLNGLGLEGVESTVCKGAEEAIQFVSRHLRPGSVGSPF